MPSDGVKRTNRNDSSTHPMRTKHFISGLLLVSVIGLAVYHRHAVITVLGDIQIAWALAGFICLLGNYCLRAIRLRLLTNGRLPLWPTGIYCICMHGFATYMLPLRSGDLSLPFLLKSTTKMALSEGAAVLFKARLLEVFTLGLWFLAAAALASPTLSRGVLLSMAACGIAMAAAPFVLKRILGLANIPFETVRKVAHRLSQTSRMTFGEIVLTGAIWLSIALGLWCITSAIHLALPLMDLFVLIALQLVMQLVPVQGFGNSGNHESGWVAALMLLEYPADAALKFALTSHAIILIYVLIIGLVALLLRHLRLR